VFLTEGRGAGGGMGWVEEGVGRCGGGVMEGRGLGIRIG
jgi:hypothetical protein